MRAVGFELVVNYKREANKDEHPTAFVFGFILIALRNSISFGDKMLFIPSLGSLTANNDGTLN